MNRNRLDLIFTRQQKNCCTVEKLRCCNSSVNEAYYGVEQQERLLKQRTIGKTLTLYKYENVILNSMT